MKILKLSLKKRKFFYDPIHSFQKIEKKNFRYLCFCRQKKNEKNTNETSVMISTSIIQIHKCFLKKAKAKKIT
jgi:hypothetical protein